MRIFLTNVYLRGICLPFFARWGVVFTPLFSAFSNLVVNVKSFSFYYVIKMVDNPRKVFIEVFNEIKSLFNLSIKYKFYRGISTFFFKFPLADL